MAQGDFTKEEAREMVSTLDEIMKAMPKAKAVNLIGNFNDLFLFLRAVEKNAPDEKK